MTLLGFFGGTEIILILIIVLLIGLLPIIALVSILTSQFEGDDKLIWALVVILLPFIGSVLYFTIGKNKRIG